MARLHPYNPVLQPGKSVAAIIHHVLATLKREHPEVNKAYFRLDNAGCYHSSRTIVARPEISASTGVQVVRVDFSDPQRWERGCRSVGCNL